MSLPCPLLYQHIQPRLDKADEIRLITILPERSENGLLQCQLEKISLLDTTDEYKEFELKGRADIDTGSLLGSWHWYNTATFPSAPTRTQRKVVHASFCGVPPVQMG
jgi:hypothetical protein